MRCRRRSPRDVSQRLLELQDRIQGEVNAGLVGRELEVLVTGWGKGPGRQSGRTSCHRIVHFDAGPDPSARAN